MGRVRHDIRFTGRVQGVGFRWTTRRVADRFEVAGWVRNEPDGSVRCVAEGDAGELKRFRAAVEEAMAGCIEATDIQEGEALDDVRGFTIR